MHHTISKPIHNLIYPYVPNRTVAGWSSPVARQAHNLKVTGSNPVPATILICNAFSVTAAEAFLRFRASTQRQHCSELAAQIDGEMALIRRQHHSLDGRA